MKNLDYITGANLIDINTMGCGWVKDIKSVTTTKDLTGAKTK